MVKNKIKKNLKGKIDNVYIDEKLTSWHFLL